MLISCGLYSFIAEPKVTIVGYYDIKLGINDPDKFFKVPDICKKVRCLGIG